MKRVYLILITVIVFVVCLIIFGNNFKKNHVYVKMENNLVKTAKKYLGLYPGFYPKDENDVILTSKLLKSKGYDTNLSKNCKGYVIIKKKSSFYNYEPYIKCDNYKTSGYKTNLSE